MPQVRGGLRIEYPFPNAVQAVADFGDGLRLSHFVTTVSTSGLRKISPDQAIHTAPRNAVRRSWKVRFKEMR